MPHKLIALALICAAVGHVANAQAADRAQQMQRVVDGLNSPDPVTRMVTLEDALANGDKNLKQIAISTALASSDQTVRTAAVEAAFSQKPSFVIEFVAGPEGKMDYWESTGGSIEVQIKDFNKDTGTFMGTTPYATSRDKQRVYKLGAISGDRISFDVSVGGFAGDNCRGSVSAKDGGTLMKGTMSCDDMPYDIQVDLLR
jgi:hypothetical protein|tara:strand:- start:4772 stop:5371 length:600 start_codon:yes stop_codon:yes gene_type:complete